MGKIKTIPYVRDFAEYMLKVLLVFSMFWYCFGIFGIGNIVLLIILSLFIGFKVRWSLIYILNYLVFYIAISICSFELYMIFMYALNIIVNMFFFVYGLKIFRFPKNKDL